jgi:AraC family transcriptional regulator, regulatory protein of adaptative response / methylated-DNA-[protein]-cysteine methyltransferase
MDGIAPTGNVTWTVRPCDLGMLALAASNGIVGYLTLHDDEAGAIAALQRAYIDTDLARDDIGLAPLVDEVRRRIAGEPPMREVPVDLHGTPFQLRVWDQLCRIPRGETRTYGEVAAAVGAPRAMRAVGSACAANPVAIVVPCHRVVPASGGTGNYGCGPERKRELLRREKAAVAG